MSKKSNLFKTLPAIILSTLLVVVVIYAWTEPTSSPPSGNVSAPINVGDSAQIKSGPLQVNGFRNTGNTILDGNVGIGTTGPGAKLDVAGGIIQRGILPYGVGGDSGGSSAGNDYAFGYQEAGAWTYPYPDLILGYHTGIKIGGYWNYNGVRFYNDHPSRAGATEIFSVGNGDNNVRVANNLIVSGQVQTTGGVRFNDGSVQTKAGTDIIITSYSAAPRSVTCSCSGSGCWAWLPTGSYGTCGNAITSINSGKKISISKMTGMYGPNSLPADACFAKVKFSDGTESNVFSGDTFQVSYPFMNIVEIRPYMTHKVCEPCSCTITIEGFEY